MPTGLPLIGTVQEMYDGELLPDIQVETFRRIDELFVTRRIAKGKHIHPLPESPSTLKNVHFVSNGQQYDLFDYISLNRVSGLLVIKNGSIAYETYQLGNHSSTLWMSMSVAKSITATLIGIAIYDGFIDSVDDPVIRYLPELKNTAYDGVNIRHVLTMTSGVKWNEAYTDPQSERRHMLDLQQWQQPGALLRYIASLPRQHEPGTHWNYSTGETQVAGEILRAAVGKSSAQYLSERVWSRFGMECDASWWLESPAGMEITGSGLSACLRDYGRFGLFLLSEGKINGRKILPPGWLDEATRPQSINGERIDYGYMFWLIPDTQKINEGAYEARGIFGQHIYINPKQDLVIASWGARPKPTGKSAVSDNDFFAAVAKALQN